ncbi:MAG TPA: hypothetical protein VHD36_22150 [Pirellulales bacterium]|nr:hypothetical protein [Pirellulales bacterium]
MKESNRDIALDEPVNDPLYEAMQRAVDADIAKQLALGNPVLVWEDDRIQELYRSRHDQDATAAAIVVDQPSAPTKREVAGHVLHDEILRTALDAMLASAEFSRRVSWWLEAGFSAERWVQFEFGYALQRTLRTRYDRPYLVYPERDRVDLSVVDVSDGGYDNVVANIELKIGANWYTRRAVFVGIQYDVNKANNYEGLRIPAVALVLWIVAEPVDSDKEYEWLRQRIQNPKCGTPSDKLEAWIGEEGIPNLQQIAKRQLKLGASSRVQLWLYRYKNALV